MQRAKWMVASTGSSSYQWSWQRCRAQGLPLCQSCTNANYNFYLDNPYTEGAFRVLFEEVNGVPNFVYSLEPIDGNGTAISISTASATQKRTDYTTRYSRAPPEICTGALLNQCLAGSMDLDTNTCVCGMHQTDTELNADFMFVPPKGFTGTI